jgi:hypothetical protein
MVPQSHRRVGAGDWSEFPAVHSLVNGEEDDAKSGVGAKPVEHRSERTSELGLNRNVIALVRPIRFQIVLLWSRSTSG